MNINSPETIKSRLRIGIFGGAFDPPHLAHAQLAQTAIDDLQLDELIVVPTGQALHKSRQLSASNHRLRMTQLAFEGMPRVSVDACELSRAGVSYSFDTLVDIKNRHLDQDKRADFYLIIGADQAEKFDTWHKWIDILQIATLAIADRPSDVSTDTTLTPRNLELDRYRWHNKDLFKSAQNSQSRANPGIAVKLNMPSMPVSATQIRELIQEGSDVSQWVSPAVLAYINSHSLYTPKSIT